MALTEFDFARGGGLDITGLATVAAGDLNNLVDLAAPMVESSGTEGKGIVLWTVDSAVGVPVVPAVATYTKWKRYLWLRVPAAADTAKIPFVYTWNDNATSIAIYAKWQRITADTTAVEALIAALQAEVDSLEIDVDLAVSLATSANSNASDAAVDAAAAVATAGIANANALQAIADLDTPTTGVKDRLTAVETVNNSQTGSINSINSQITTINNSINSGLGPVFLNTPSIILAVTAGAVTEASYSLTGIVPTTAKAVILEAFANGGSFESHGVYARRDTSMSALCIALAASVQAGNIWTTSQGLCPISATHTILYSTVGGTGISSGGLKLVGYIL